jgi:hypothetical protein
MSNTIISPNLRNKLNMQHLNLDEVIRQTKHPKNLSQRPGENDNSIYLQQRQHYY